MSKVTLTACATRYCSKNLRERKTTTKVNFSSGIYKERKALLLDGKGNLSIVGERKKMFKLPEKTSNYHSLDDERKIVLQLYEAERDIKLSTDRREILNRMHNAVIVKGVKDHVVTPYTPQQERLIIPSRAAVIRI